MINLSRTVKPNQAAPKISVGINGFGRFGLHLFRHWLARHREANFSIDYINDMLHTTKTLVEAIKNDEVLGPLPHSIRYDDQNIFVENGPAVGVSSVDSVLEIPWHNHVDMVFECTGKFTERSLAARHLRGRVKRVLISASSLSADIILILGINHHEYNSEKHTVISYGSCTVNAYLPIAKILHDKFGLEESSVHVTHNTPLRDIQKPFGTIGRRGCTLNYVVPLFFPFLKNRFYATYRLVPYPGVSLMDIRFRLKKNPSSGEVLKVLEAASQGPLDIHLEIDTTDADPNQYIGNSSSAIIIASEVRKVGNDILVSAWFDNENSAARLFDTASFLINQGL